MEDYKKKYEELIEKLSNAKKEKGGYSFKSVIESVVSELKESEDDKMREMAIKAVNAPDAQSCIKSWGVNPEDVVAWLEKQGEQKEKQYITITQKILDYIDKHKHRFENSIPKLGDYWKVIEICKYPSVNNGKPVVEVVNEGSGDWMRLPLNIVDIKIEQKPTDKVEPKFKVGDLIVNSTNNIYKVLCIIDDEYRLSNNIDGNVVCAKTETIDKKYHLWTIQDAKDGNVLYMDNGLSTCTFIYETINNDIIQKYASYNKFGFEGRHYLVLNDGYVCPATKEQRDLLFQKMKEAGYEWDAEKKELKKIEQSCYYNDGLYYAIDILEKTLGKVEGYQSDDGILEHKCAISAVKQFVEQKPAWSEEDEEMLRRCISATFDHGYLKECDWLKSLKDKVRSSIDEKSIPSEEFVLNVWMLGNEWKDITKGVCDTEHGTQLDYVLKHWKEGEYYEKIKPQSYWKPTKDQMEIIEMVLTDEAMDDNVHSILKSLYNDLKAL